MGTKFLSSQKANLTYHWNLDQCLTKRTLLPQDSILDTHRIPFLDQTEFNCCHSNGIQLSPVNKSQPDYLFFGEGRHKQKIQVVGHGSVSSLHMQSDEGKSTWCIFNREEETGRWLLLLALSTCISRHKVKPARELPQEFFILAFMTRKKVIKNLKIQVAES